MNDGLPFLSNKPVRILKGEYTQGTTFGECYPFWNNDNGGFKEHKQLNWTNLFLIRRFGMAPLDQQYPIDGSVNSSSEIKSQIQEIRNVQERILSELDNIRRALEGQGMVCKPKKTNEF